MNFWYIEAYEIDRKLQSMEESFISRNSPSEAQLTRIRSINHWRAGLVGKGMELLPSVLQHQVKTGKFPEVVTPTTAMDISKPDVHVSRGSILPSLLAHPLDDPVDNPINSTKPSFLETPSKFGTPILFKVGSNGSPSPPTHLFNDTEKAATPASGLLKNFKLHEFTPRTNRRLSTTKRSSSRARQNNHLRSYSTNKISSERLQKVFPNDSLVSKKLSLLTDSLEKSDNNAFAKRVPPDTDRSWVLPSSDSMDCSWRCCLVHQENRDECFDCRVLKMFSVENNS